jgi:serine/threonine protein kinase
METSLNNSALLYSMIFGFVLLCSGLLTIIYFKTFRRKVVISKPIDKNVRIPKKVLIPLTSQNVPKTEFCVNPTNSDVRKGTSILVFKEFGLANNISTTESSKTKPGISFAEFKTKSFANDFILKELQASGVFGDLYRGTIINSKIFHNYNDDIRECFIKKVCKKMSEELFFQELSMYQLFSTCKYFSKLISFSEDPQVLVFKFYKYGVLRELIYPGKAGIDYTISLVFSLCIKIFSALMFMHEQGVVHNDIKLDNIWLDGDSEEHIFPVIADFGLVRILDSHDLIDGLQVSEIKACTSVYVAPEILWSFKNKLQKRVSTFKTDVYSGGIVMYKLYSRDEMKKTFNVQALLEGCFPSISFEKIQQQWKEIQFELANDILNLLMDSLEANPEKRITTEKVYKTLCDLQKKIRN